MKEFQPRPSRDFLLRRMGEISQLAGLRRFEFSEGKAKGVEAVDFHTGSGLEFTVLPGRGMDIAWAAYRGVPLAYMSKTGVVSPAYYESAGINWLRNFFAGLLTTCGLSNVGGPCQEEDPELGTRQHGLHGRISNMAADQVCVQEEWRGDDLVMTASGRLREAMLHGESLTLRRQVQAHLGESRLVIHDVVENEGLAERPLMILYHINLGYPVLDEHSRLIGRSREIQPNSELAKAELDQWSKMGPPVAGAAERVYFHDLAANLQGEARMALVNDALELGVYVRFNKNRLPRLTEWKNLGAADYVVGIEPGNCAPVGQAEQRKRGGLEHIKPGEKREFEVEIGVLPDREAIAAFEKAWG